MIFRFDNKLLKKMIPLIVQIVPKKTTMPVLTFVKFSIENGVLYLNATNMESLLIIRLCSNLNLPNMSFLIKAQVLQDILKNIVEDYLQVEINDKNIKIQNIYTLFKCDEPFPTRDLNQFTFFEQIDIEKFGLLFDGIDLNLKDDGNVRIEFNKHLVMYDRRRMSLTDLKDNQLYGDLKDNETTKNPIYLDPQLMRTVLKIFNENKVILKTYKNELLFCQQFEESNELKSDSSILDINFIIKQKTPVHIQYEHLLNFQKECFHFSVNTKELIKALKTTLVLSSVLTRCIKCIINNNQLTIESFDPSMGNSSVTIDCMANSDITFNLNGDYLLESLHVDNSKTPNDSSAKIETNIYYTNPFKPIIVHNKQGEKDFLFETVHIIMPIRIS